MCTLHRVHYTHFSFVWLFENGFIQTRQKHSSSSDENVLLVTCFLFTVNHPSFSHFLEILLPLFAMLFRPFRPLSFVYQLEWHFSVFFTNEELFFVGQLWDRAGDRLCLIVLCWGLVMLGLIWGLENLWLGCDDL